MIPLIPALILAFLSFISSAFVILRLVIPILPPHPLSKRVSPAEFGLPRFRSLSPADKGHVWLASLDLVAVSVFIWQIVNESTVGPTTAVDLATDPGSAVRLWIAVTIRQACLLIIVAVTLLHVRMAQSVSFGAKHWMLWAPTALLVITSTAVAGILSGTGYSTLFTGVIAYSITIGVLSTVSFLCLVRTLFMIKKNLAPKDENAQNWPSVRVAEEKPRPSFTTEEIDAIRDGASWITSSAGSRRNSMSAWSFSTHHTITTSNHGQGRMPKTTQGSVPAKSSFWFGSTTANDIQIPPVPPLPSPYGPASPALAESDPFRRDLPPLPHQQKPRFGSQSSWLTSSAGSHTTITSWSYPTTYHEGTIHDIDTQDLRTAYSPDPLTTAYSPEPRPVTPAMADAQVLGGYGYAPAVVEVEKGLASLATHGSATVQISLLPAFTWSVTIWLPLALALPYFISLLQNTIPSTALQVLFILSVTISSPMLALSLLIGSPLPIPVGLFDAHNPLPKNLDKPLVHADLPPRAWSHEYKRSTSCSVTVVEGRRSGDVWLSKGDAVDGKGKIGRAIGMLSTTPKLSVMPPEDNDDHLDMPPVPIHDDSLPVNIGGTPQSENSVQFGRMRKESKASSHFSGGDESMAFASRIMIAQRHYSALAQTMVVPAGGNSGNRDSAAASTLISIATGAGKRSSHQSHLRSRSTASSVYDPPETPTGQERFNASPTPPPPFPLPPTPPNVRAARLAMLQHKKSFSSGHDFMFKAVDDMNEIDAMTAGVLPLLVPGLKVGENMKIKDGKYSPPVSLSKGSKVAKKLAEFGEDFSSPEVHSTPARRRQPRGRKESGHKRNHFSLPSLTLGKDAIHSLASDVRSAFEGQVAQYMAVASAESDTRRNTVLGVECALQSVQEEVEKVAKPLGRTMSTRSLGLRADVPHNVDTARSSVTSLAQAQPPSAASTVTLFEEFEAGLHQAESTPHNSVSQKPTSRGPAPPMPNRRSSIRYIKSDVNEQQVVPHVEQAPMVSISENSVVSPLTSWSSRAVKLIPKASKRSSTDSTSPKEGLRTLTLLQDRANTVKGNGNNSPTTAEIRPLTLSKRNKIAKAHQDENSNPGAASRNKNIKSLTLSRSDTSKMRGALRKTEVLPDVVVRPPSTSEHHAFVYSFRD
ncbi:hypothetical protein CPC08DRAFT_814238 [Agrocybe pediades]|nr:hypothetical protein CPC08DRAFT_814238 [Agrocybe pediades]